MKGFNKLCQRLRKATKVIINFENNRSKIVQGLGHKKSFKIVSEASIFMNRNRENDCL